MFSPPTPKGVGGSVHFPTPVVGGIFVVFPPMEGTKGAPYTYLPLTAAPPRLNAC